MLFLNSWLLSLMPFYSVLWASGDIIWVTLVSIHLLVSVYLSFSYGRILSS